MYVCMHAVAFVSAGRFRACVLRGTQKRTRLDRWTDSQKHMQAAKFTRVMPCGGIPAGIHAAYTAYVSVVNPLGYPRMPQMLQCDALLVFSVRALVDHAPPFASGIISRCLAVFVPIGKKHEAECGSQGTSGVHTPVSFMDTGLAAGNHPGCPLTATGSRSSPRAPHQIFVSGAARQNRKRSYRQGNL